MAQGMHGCRSEIMGEILRIDRVGEILDPCKNLCVTIISGSLRAVCDIQVYVKRKIPQLDSEWLRLIFQLLCGEGEGGQFVMDAKSVLFELQEQQVNEMRCPRESINKGYFTTKPSVLGGSVF